jgi:stage V sporulation protein B
MKDLVRICILKFNLFYGLIISTIISALGIIFLARLLSPSEIGILAIAVVAPNLFAQLRDWGVNSAMTRFIAKYKSENKTAQPLQQHLSVRSEICR